jgi:hypothetical protein
MNKQQLNDEVSKLINIYTDTDWQKEYILKLFSKDLFILYEQYLISFDQHIDRNSDEYLWMYRQRCDREWLFGWDLEHTEEFENSQQNIYFYN